MDDGPVIRFNGKTYDFVQLPDLTIDEALILWDYAHISIDKVQDIDGFHPGVVAALIHVSVARAEPDVSAKAIRKLVGATPMSALEEVFADISVEVDESVPPPNAPGSESETSGSSASSGEGSSTTGEPPPADTEGSGSGIPVSGIGAASDPVTSAV